MQPPPEKASAACSTLTRPVALSAMTDKDASQRASAPEHLIVGQVVAPFGVKGELKVNILTEFPDRFRKLEQVILAPFSSIEPGLAPTAALDPATLRHRATGPRTPVKGPTVQTPYQIQSTHVHKGQLLL